MNKRLLIIVNPSSGKCRGMSILRDTQNTLQAANIESDVFITEWPGHAKQISREVELAAYEGLCLIGGDGTLHEVISGLLQRNPSPSIAVGIIPGGTGNDVTRQLGIENSTDGVQRIAAGKTQGFDVMRVETEGTVEFCLTLVGWNAVAEVNRTAEKLRMLGHPRYAISAAWQILFPKRRKATLKVDGQNFEDEFLMIVACNTVFVGSGMQLAPLAITDDGKVDVVVVRKASRWQLARLFAKVFTGSHVKMSCIEYFQSESLEILSDDCLPLDMDGEVRGSTPVSIQVLPGAIQFFV